MTRSPISPGTDRLTAIDLFAGAGGFSRGLVDAGFDVLGAVDNWVPAARTYQLNFGHPFVEGDLGDLKVEALRTAFGVESVDLVVGGPPCQGFSIQRIGEDHDSRNHLVLDFARMVAGLRPRMFIMENVPGLLGKRGRPLATEFADRVRRSGYDAYSTMVAASDYGVPQTRRRVFFCGWLRGEVEPFPFPKATHSTDELVTVWDAIGDLPPPPADHTPPPGDRLHRRTRMSQRNLERLTHIPPGGGFEAIPVSLRVDCHRNGANRIGHRNVYGRLAADKPAGTITARFDSFTRGKFAHPLEDRNITLREGARLQTFEDPFEFIGTQEEVAALIGNAVPPRLAAVTCRAAFSHLLGQGENGGHVSPDALQQLGLFHTTV